MALDLIAVGLTTLDIAIHPVARMPAVDEGVLADTIRLSPAGTAAGTALIAARLGLSVALASAVGDDLQGLAVRSGLEREGVDTRWLATDPQAPTSTTVLPVTPHGQRGTVHMIGASMTAPLPDALRAGDVTAAGVHWGGVGYPGLAGQGAPFLAAMRERGAFVTCDLISPRPGAMDELADLLPHVDLFLPSLAEVVALTGSDDVDVGAHVFLALGARQCAIKSGAAGVRWFDGARATTIPAFTIDPVDTTSCGDAFCAGVHAGRRRGLDPAAGPRFAAATAAFVAQGVGTLGALVDGGAVARFAATAKVRS